MSVLFSDSHCRELMPTRGSGFNAFGVSQAFVINHTPPTSIVYVFITLVCFMLISYKT